jgi:hypothetical protein
VFSVGAICSVGLDAHTIMPAILFLAFPEDRLFWLGWILGTGALVMLVVWLVSLVSARPAS